MIRDVFNLQVFEKTALTASFRIQVDLKAQGSALHLEYHVKGPMERVVLPKPVKEGLWTEELWKESCFEIFLKETGSAHYWEWNFSPSGNFWSMEFEEYRIRKEACEQLRPLREIEAKLGPKDFKLQVQLPLPRLPREVGVSAILKLNDGFTCHWALKHPAARPDFHDFRGFTQLIESNF